MSDRKKKERITQKYQGKVLYDTRYNEHFTYEEKSDWQVLYEEPNRFQVID